MASIADFPLNIDPSWWNVIKFVALSLILTPSLELLFDTLFKTFATYLVARGHPVLLSETNLGIFSIHNAYCGRHRNVLLVLLPGMLLLATDLLFEFSFSTATADVSHRRTLWSQSTHQQRYLASDYVVVEREPTAFPDQAAQQCLGGPILMERRRNSHSNMTERESFLGPFEYVLEGQYRIRKPFLDQDNSTVWCGLHLAVVNATIIVPGVYRKHDFDIEGYDMYLDHPDMEQWRQIANNAAILPRGELRFDGLHTKFFVGNQSACVHAEVEYMRHSLCMLTNGSHVALVRSRMQNEHDFSHIQGVVMLFYGNAVAALSEPARQVRLLAHIMEKRTLSDLYKGHTAGMVRRLPLMQHASAALMVANEEGVGGVHTSTFELAVRCGSRQIAVAKRIVCIPLAMLCALIAMIFALEISLRVATIRRGNNFDVSWRWWPFSGGSRIDSSNQWFRERLATDLQRLGIYPQIQSLDIVPWASVDEKGIKWHILPDPCLHNTADRVCI